MYQNHINIYPTILLYISFNMVCLLNSYIYGYNIYRVSIKYLFKPIYSIYFSNTLLP